MHFPQKLFVWALNNFQTISSFIDLKISRPQSSNVYIWSNVNWLLSWHWHPWYDAAVVKVVAALIVFSYTIGQLHVLSCLLHAATQWYCTVCTTTPDPLYNSKQVPTYTYFWRQVWWTLHWTGGFYFFTCFAPTDITRMLTDGFR